MDYQFKQNAILEYLNESENIKSNDIIAYHGTRYKFDEFEAFYPKAALGNKKGVYFTRDLSDAISYAEDVDGALDELSRVIKVKLIINSQNDGEIIDHPYRGEEIVMFNINNIKILDYNVLSKSINENIQSNDIIAYHGTDSKFNVFNDNNPIFFVDDIDVARTYGNFIIKCKLIMDNPIILDFDGKSTYYFFDKWYVPSELAKRIKHIAVDIKNRYSLDDDLKEYLEYLDFSDMYGDLDGIIMKNIDDVGDGMFSEHKHATNYVVFDKNNIIIEK